MPDVHVAVVSQNADIVSDVRPRAVASALAEAGYAVSLVGPTGGSGPHLAIDTPGVALHSFDLPVRARGAIGQVREQSLAMGRAARVLIAIARKCRVDVLHVGNPPDNGWLLQILLWLVQGSRPLFVYDQHDPAPLLVAEKFGRRGWIRVIESVLSWFEAASLRHAALVVFANEGFRRRADELGLLRSRGVVVPNGWSLSVNGASPRLAWRDPSLPLLTYVGTTSGQDGLGHLVEAMALLKVRAQLVVVGDGDARIQAEELARRMGISDRTVWLGWVTDRSLITRLVAEADVCVAPETSSPVNNITSFVKIIEYMSLGAPIAAHRLPQTELVAGDAIEYAESDEPRALADAVERLLADPSLASSRRQASRQRFEQALRWEVVGAPRLVQGYRSMGPPAAPGDARWNGDRPSMRSRSHREIEVSSHSTSDRASHSSRMTILGGRILGYHRITSTNDSSLCVSPDDLRYQMRALLAIGMKPGSLASLTSGQFVPTFDDGYEDSYLEALPVLEHYGIRGVFYVCPLYVGRHQREVDDRVLLEEPAKFLNWEQLADMAQRGHVIGSHGMTHRELTSLDDDELAEELQRSRAMLEERLGQSVVDFCYPRGKYDDRVLAAVAKAGYARAVVTPSRRSVVPRGPLTRERVGLERHDVGWRFWARVTGMNRVAARLYRAVNRSDSPVMNEG
jgi:glycosyltransferase involved in cell wall biosynthesis/peptidoglycan/xylan/chitin deacetylase (PgdA/CDA1 family)